MKRLRCRSSRPASASFSSATVRHSADVGNMRPPLRSAVCSWRQDSESGQNRTITAYTRNPAGGGRGGSSSEWERSTVRVVGTPAYQTLEMMVDGLVTLAGGVLQVYGIEHLDMSPPVLDEARFLQLPGNHRHATALYAQHLRQELLRQRQRVGLQ